MPFDPVPAYRSKLRKERRGLVDRTGGGEGTGRPMETNPALKAARKLVIGVIGGTVVIAGIAMLVLPGPAIVVIPLGLAILATEFVWAKRLLSRVRSEVQKRTKGNRSKTDNSGKTNGDV